MNYLFWIIAIVLALAVLKFVSRIIGKLIGFVVIIGLVGAVMYFNGWGPFQTTATSPEHLMDTYCRNDHPQPAYCECIVKPIVADLERRFSPRELDDLNEKRLESAYAFKKSLEAQKLTITQCLESRDEEGLLREFLLNLSGLPESVIEGVDLLKDSVEVEANERFEDFENRKEAINKRY